MTALAVREALAEREAIIERGLATFVQVGGALAEIRDERLYRNTHATFEDYCRERWGFRREVADRYVRAAEVVEVLNPIGLPAPGNEAVARELAPLRSEPERMAEVWAEARGRAEETGRPVTAADVRTVVEEGAPAAPEPIGAPGVRALKQQQKLVAGIAERALHIYQLAPALDLNVVKSIPQEEREQWDRDVTEARTVLGRLSRALRAADDE